MTDKDREEAREVAEEWMSDNANYVSRAAYIIARIRAEAKAEALAELHAETMNGGASCHFCASRIKAEALKEAAERVHKKRLRKGYEKTDFNAGYQHGIDTAIDAILADETKQGACIDLKPCPFCGKPAKEYRYGVAVGCSDNVSCCAIIEGDPNNDNVDAQMINLAEAWNRRALPPEPRTCETCGEYGRDDADCNGYRTGMECIDRSNWKSKAPRSPKSADVETVRECLHNVVRYACDKDLELEAQLALTALDRLAGVLH